MRLEVSTAALLQEEQPSLPEFGTGLRARLDVVRALEVVEPPLEIPEPALEVREPVLEVPVPTVSERRDISPELMLVSPAADSAEGLLSELLAQRVHETREPLGALLAEAGLLAEAEVDLALRTARRHGKRLGEVLTELGLVAPADVVRLVAQQRGLPFVDVATLPVDPSAARLLPADHARSFRTLPIGFVRGLPVVALADPSDDEAIHGARSMLRAAEFVASPEEAILAQLARLYVRAV